MHSLGPRQCYGVRGDIFCCCCKFYISIQDVLFCLPNDFTCYSEVSQATSDCDVSCTGLYSDVVFTEDKILNLETDFGKSKCFNFSTTKKFTVDGRGLGVSYRGADTDKNRKGLLKLLEDYTDYTKSFVQQIHFNPRMSNLSK